MKGRGTSDLDKVWDILVTKVNLTAVLRTLTEPCRGNIAKEIINDQLLTSGYNWLFDNPYKPAGTIVREYSSITCVILLTKSESNRMSVFSTKGCNHVKN